MSAEAESPLADLRHWLLDVEGTLEDRPVTLNWPQVSDGDTPEPSFRFKYFQQLEGYLTLPDGFSPTRLLLTLETGERGQPARRGYAWNELLNSAVRNESS